MAYENTPDDDAASEDELIEESEESFKDRAKAYCVRHSTVLVLGVVVKTRARATLAKDPDRTSDIVGRVQLKQDVQVTAIANAVERGVAHFQQVVKLCGASTSRCT